MNVENIRALAKHLRQPEQQEHFSLSNWFIPAAAARGLKPAEAIHLCGTVACIAGHAAMMANPKLNLQGFGGVASEVAMEFLDIDHRLAHELFTPGVTVSYRAVTASIAADVLDKLADTGQVIWPSSVLV